MCTCGTPYLNETGCYSIQSPTPLPKANVDSFLKCGFSCSPTNTSCANLAPCDSICHPASGKGLSCVADGLSPGPIGSVVDPATGTCKKENECNSTNTCNVCTACCKSYIHDGLECGSYVKSECNSPQDPQVRWSWDMPVYGKLPVIYAMTISRVYLWDSIS